MGLLHLGTTLNTSRYPSFLTQLVAGDVTVKQHLHLRNACCSGPTPPHPPHPTPGWSACQRLQPPCDSLMQLNLN